MLIMPLGHLIICVPTIVSMFSKHSSIFSSKKTGAKDIFNQTLNIFISLTITVATPEAQRRGLGCIETNCWNYHQPLWKFKIASNSIKELQKRDASCHRAPGWSQISVYQCSERWALCCHGHGGYTPFNMSLFFFFFLSGILHKGNGENVFLSQQPPVISTVMGNGFYRSVPCGPSCSGAARDMMLFAPVALASGPDGSLYVGDFNFIRRVHPDGYTRTILELKWDRDLVEWHLWWN